MAHNGGPDDVVDHMTLMSGHMTFPFLISA
jgi:hypothetical protein